MVIVKDAGVEDWQALKHLHAKLQMDKARNYISCSLEELESFLLNSKLFPQVKLLVVEWDRRIAGLAAMMLIDAPQMGQTGVYAQRVRHVFIHAAYVPSWVGVKERVPREAGPKLWEAMEGWSKQMGACFIYGNVRLDGNFNAFERKYGLKKQHVVIGKNLEVTSG